MVALRPQCHGGVIACHTPEFGIETDLEAHIRQNDLWARDGAFECEHATVVTLMRDQVQLTILKDKLIDGRGEGEHHDPFAGDFLNQ